MSRSLWFRVLVPVLLLSLILGTSAFANVQLGSIPLEETVGEESDDAEAEEAEDELELTGTVVAVNIPGVVSQEFTEEPEEAAETAEATEPSETVETGNTENSGEGTEVPEETEPSSTITIIDEAGAETTLEVAELVRIEAPLNDDGMYLINPGDLVELTIIGGLVAEIRVETTTDGDEEEDDDDVETITDGDEEEDDDDNETITDGDEEEDDGDNETAADIPGLQVRAYAGRITAVGEKVSIVTANGQEHSFGLSEATAIFWRSRTLAADDLQVGLKVTVKNNYGEAQWIRIAGDEDCGDLTQLRTEKRVEAAAREAKQEERYEERHAQKKPDKQPDERGKGYRQDKGREERGQRQSRGGGRGR
ncbi:MAG: hypothetical protein AB1331_01215 [Bacillota bacterium]